MAEKNGVQNPDNATKKDDSVAFKEKVKHWAIIGGVGLVGALIVAAIVPRAWANFIGGVVNESWLTGILVGAAIGFVCTFVPYWLLSAGWRRRASGSSNIFLILGLIVAIPNLITLWIVLGVNNAAKIGNDRLNLDAPGFKLGTLLGVIAAVALAVFFWNLQRQRDAAKAEAAKERERAEAQAAAAATDTTRVVEHSEPSSSGTGTTAGQSTDSSPSTDPPIHP